MHNSIPTGKLLGLSDACYSITWTSERINRLLLHNREIHLWSDFHNANQYAEQLWSSEGVITLTEEEAIQLIFEWVSNGPFVSYEADWSRIPASLRERLKKELSSNQHAAINRQANQ